MKKEFLGLAVSLLLATSSAWGLENTVQPAITAPLEKAPQTALLIGNSYSFYNCGVHGYLRGFMQDSQPPIKMRTRLLTISSGTLSYHDVAYYLQPHEQDPYAKVVDGKLAHPMFDIVLLQDNSAAATSKKRIPYLFRYTKIDADIIRKAGSTPLLVMTWPRKDKPKDITKLADNTIQAANEAKMRVVPVGLAFMEAIRGKPDLEMYMPDKSHPSAAGSYLYGAVLYSVLFRRSPEPLRYLGECEKPLVPETAAYLRTVAWKVVKDFYHW